MSAPSLELENLLDITLEGGASVSVTRSVDATGQKSKVILQIFFRRRGNVFMAFLIYCGHGIGGLTGATGDGDGNAVIFPSWLIFVWRHREGRSSGSTDTTL